jgi:cobaltochelatase CobN
MKRTLQEQWRGLISLLLILIIITQGACGDSSGMVVNGTEPAPQETGERDPGSEGQVANSTVQDPAVNQTGPVPLETGEPDPGAGGQGDPATVQDPTVNQTEQVTPETGEPDTGSGGQGDSFDPPVNQTGPVPLETGEPDPGSGGQGDSSDPPVNQTGPVPPEEPDLGSGGQVDPATVQDPAVNQTEPVPPGEPDPDSGGQGDPATVQDPAVNQTGPVTPETGEPDPGSGGLVDNTTVQDPAVNQTEPVPPGEPDPGSGDVIQESAGMSGILPEDRGLAIVAGGLYNLTELTNATSEAPLKVSLFSEDEALLHDFSADPLIFVASVAGKTVDHINATMNETALVIVHDLPAGNDFGIPADATIAAYWTYGGERNLRNMIIYMDNLFFGNSTPVDPPVRPGSYPDHALAIVTNDTERAMSVANATGSLPFTVSLYNETETLLHDFGSEAVIFAASVGNTTVDQINATAGENATVIVYDLPPGTSLGIPADPIITRYWSYGGDENILNMLLYIDNTYFGNSTPVPPPRHPDADIPDIVMIIGGVSYVPMYADAAKVGYANVTVYAASFLPPDLDLSGYDLVFMEMFTAGIDLIEPAVQNATARGIPIMVLHGGEYEHLGTVDMTQYPAVEEYWQNSGPENARRLINYLSAVFCGADTGIEDPVPTPKESIYHPDADMLFEDLDEYLTWYSENSTYDPLQPTIGIVFYDTNYKSGDLKGEHALYRALEARGANIIPVYLYYTNPDIIDRFFVRDGSPVVDAIINIRSFRFYGATPERGIERLQKFNIPILNAHTDYYKTPEEWAVSTDGIDASMIGSSLAMPELDGQIDFIWTAGRGIDPATEAIGFRPITPVDEQVRWLADRALALASLRHTSNAGKKVAVIYYNHGGGKNNLGATYLDIVPSLQNLLSAMKAEGYTIQGEVPNEDDLLSLMLLEGRNIGTWAPEELDRMVEAGDVTLIPEEEYLAWFHELPAGKQQEVIDTWGEPPGEIMVYEKSGEQYLVIPKISFGNVILAPQPMRGWLQDSELLYHDKDLPPHHQYIAFYFWLRKGFCADAIVHFGTHGTQEWLPGKERGLSATDCWPALLIGECPNVYPYIMDNLGEGTQAKRRGNAVIIDHLTPPIVTAGLYGDLLVLHEKIHAYGTVNGTLRDEYRKSITGIYQDMGLNASLDLSPAGIEGMSDDEFSAFITGDLHQYLHALGDELIPYGLHILGEPPEGDEHISLVQSMLGEKFEEHVAAVYPEPHDLSAAHGNCTVLFALLAEVLLNGTAPGAAQEAILGSSTPDITSDLHTALRYSSDISACTIEIPGILNALRGGFTPPGTGGDPVRNPDGLPTGNNFHSFDSRTMPTPEAWNVGVTMAEEMIGQYGEEHEGAYPRKVAFVLWAYEAMLHEGVTESEALYLMGVRPVWSRGKVIDVELIPSADLGRPRIDVLFTASGLYRDTFADKIELLDKAVRLAAQAEGDVYPNYVQQNSEELYTALRASGCDEDTARSLSMARVFSEAPGSYGTGLSSAIDASDTWEDTEKLVDLYLSRVGNVYGSDGWGEPNQALFRENLAAVEAAVHSRSSNVVGVIDNDDCYQYFGAISLAVREITGTGPEMYISDLRTPDRPQTTTLREFIRTELNARYFNPKWIEGMMEHGYAGARYMDTQFTENLWGWTVTNPEIIGGDVWDRVFEVYMNDKYDLGLDQYFSENPYAYQSMIARMTEVARKEYWDPDQEVLEKLARDYEQSVEMNGVTCCHHTCGNLALADYMQQIDQSSTGNIPSTPSPGRLPAGGGGGGGGGSAPSLPSGITGATQANTSFSSGNEQQAVQNTSETGGYGMNADLVSAPVESAVRSVKGAVMKVVSQDSSSAGTSSTPLIPIVIVLVLIGAFGFGFLSKRR